MEVQQEAKGLLAALLDFSFTSFVTTKIIKFLYGLGLLLGALSALLFLKQLRIGKRAYLGLA